MGRALARAVIADPACTLSGAIEAEGHPDLGADCGALAGHGPAGIAITEDARAALANADAIIDFTRPAVSLALAALAAERRLVHVIGTTGFSGEEERSIAASAQDCVIVKSGNMSMGVTLLAALVARAARALPDFDVEILEMHHRMKADAPSGTALLLGEAAARGRATALESDAARSGHTGPRKPGTVGFASLRGGTVVGEHQVVLAGPHERIILGHIAEDRTIFANGAVAAAKWGRSQKPGLYGMTGSVSPNSPAISRREFRALSESPR
jgi:4-hydroxy-tetrahydrodipicolinate reductase